MNEEYFMREAIKESEKAASSGNLAVGCVVVLNDKIISRAPTTKHQNKDRFEHAEINAIRKVSVTYFVIKKIYCEEVPSSETKTLSLLFEALSGNVSLESKVYNLENASRIAGEFGRRDDSSYG
mgnify:CR=1 FL=1